MSWGRWYYKLILSSEWCRRMAIVQRCIIFCRGLVLFLSVYRVQKWLCFIFNLPWNPLRAWLPCAHVTREDTEKQRCWVSGLGCTANEVRVLFLCYCAEHLFFFVEYCSLSHHISKWKRGCVCLTASQGSKFVIFKLFYFIFPITVYLLFHLPLPRYPHAGWCKRKQVYSTLTLLSRVDLR